MAIEVKICGITDEAALKAAIEGGARYVGFVFYPASPRALSIDAAAKLAKLVPVPVIATGLFVDPVEEDIREVLKKVPLRMLQLHGKEKPGRIRRLKRAFKMPIMKAVGIDTEEDFTRVPGFEEVADRILFDAKPSAKQLPGGNAQSFEWNMLGARTFSKPWMLAGGLNPENLAEAVAQSGATAVDVSSGVEDAPGRKNPDKIRAFLETAKQL